MKVFVALAKNGGLDMSDYQRATLKDFITENEGDRLRLTIDKLQPESKHQRNFYHGAILPLWAYLDGNNYTNSVVLDQYHEYAKQEFNAQWLVINKKAQKVGGSTKGNLKKYLDDIIDYLEENYGIDRMEVLNPEDYKYWRDTIFGFGECNTYIEYLVSLNKLKSNI